MADQSSSNAGSVSRSARPAGRTRRKRDSLNRENILEAAERIAERDGLEGLTFQSLGDELDAHPTSMYRHFRDKDELVRALIDSLRDRSYLGSLVPTGDWRDDLRLAARVVHEHYLRYPQFAQQMAVRTTRLPREFANMEYTLRALLDAGFDGEEALHYQRVFGNYVRSFASIESASHMLSEETQREDELAWRLQYEQLDPEEFPAMTGVDRPPLGIGDPDTFDFGLELLIDGLQARAQARSARSSRN
ncbi:MAG: TetR/AcrR family transcriptional regulator C-terminal domain-containing protein [Actinobacteria bacterium]|nr:TetR/AcrR family transcriptional regulator C-terminal domain-containing protein [Actinomycetota bacterium]